MRTEPMLALGEAVTRRLKVGEWRPSTFAHPFSVVTLDRPLGGQMVAVLEVVPTRPAHRRAGPQVRARVGVAFTPALDLAAVLAVPVRACVVFLHDRDGPPDARVFDLGGDGADVEEVSEQIARVAAAGLVELTARFTDLSAFEDAMKVEQRWYRHAVPLGHAVLLAVTGRVAEASDLVIRPNADSSGTRASLGAGARGEQAQRSSVNWHGGTPPGDLHRHRSIRPWPGCHPNRPDRFPPGPRRASRSA